MRPAELKPEPYRTPNGYGVRLGAARVAGMFPTEGEARAWIAGRALKSEDAPRLAFREWAFVVTFWTLGALLLAFVFWVVAVNSATIAAGLVLAALAAFIMGM